MLHSATQWLNTTSLTNPIERRQAGIFQAMLLIVIAACVIGLPVGMATSSYALWSALCYLGVILAAVASLAMVRQGRFAPAVLLTCTALELVLGVSLIGTGLTVNTGTLLAFSVPITMAGLLQGRRGLVVTVGICVVTIVVTTALHLFAPSLIGFMILPRNMFVPNAISYLLSIGVLCLIIDRFGGSLREALAVSQNYAHELEQLRGSLEVTVAERTTSLQVALAEVAQREARLAEALEALQSSNDTVRSLSAPIIPVLPGVLVAPLIGDVNAERAELLMGEVLTAVERETVHHVIFDITGVPVVDTQVAQVLLRSATAVRLLGARTLLVGVRPEVAQTLVSLGIDLAAVQTFADLRAAVGTLLSR